MRQQFILFIMTIAIFFFSVQHVHLNANNPNTVHKIERIEVQFQKTLDDKNFHAFIVKHPNTELSFIALQKILAEDIYAKNWGGALMMLHEYRNYFHTPLLEQKCNALFDIFSADDTPINIIPLPARVNSSADDYLPSITADGKSLYFTSINPNGHNDEDIFLTTFENGRWSAAQQLDDTINTPYNDSANSISPDGTKLVLYGDYQGGYGNGDNFYSSMTIRGWSEVRPLPRPLNSKYFDSDGIFTPDGNAFIFVSDRPGGIGEYHPKDALFHGDLAGNTDIYICEWDGQQWSDPINLGPAINTPYAERTPFLHPDGKTLYFSSSGHAGLGGLDVFKTVRKSPNSWTEWEEPVNLGKAINTPQHDWGYVVSTSGNHAYIAAMRSSSQGGLDLYQLSVPPELQPKIVVLIRGTVTDPDGTPLQATIRWEDLHTGKLIGYADSNPQTGKFALTLPVGKKYGYFADKDGYLGISQNIDLHNETTFTEKVINIIMYPIADAVANNIAIRINNLFFDYNSAKLKPESYPELRRLVKLLVAYPGNRIEISGHTDNKGKSAYNLELSLARAQAVADYLIKWNIDESRIEVKGLGENNPIARNDTPEGRRKNRRVEFILLQ